MAITLTATEVPEPMPNDGTSVLIADCASGVGPLTSEIASAGQTPVVSTNLNKNARRAELGSSFGAGFYAIGDGLALTAGVGLQASVDPGHIVCDGVVEFEADTVALTPSVRNFVWAKRDGTLEVRTDLTPPSQAAVPLGSLLTDADSITQGPDYSGVFYFKGGFPIRETFDAGVPGDTPDASLFFFTRTQGGVYIWDGEDYQLMTPATATTELGVGSGGTGSDLSATGPGVVVQDVAGDPLDVRALVAADLPAATTSAIGAVELAEDGESGAGLVLQSNDGRLADYGQILFPALDVYGTDITFFEAAAGSMYAMLVVPRHDIAIRYIHVAKGNADPAESLKGCIVGPIDRPVRGSRRVTPATDSPVLRAKAADTVAPSASGLITLDTGAAVTLQAGKAYFVVVQFEEAMNVMRLTARATIVAGAAAGVSSIFQQLVFVGTASVPTYATDFGTVGSATPTAGVTWDANAYSMPIFGLS